MTAISRSRGRRAAHTTFAVGAVCLGLVALTACEKPSPNAHFTLGTSTKSTETDSGCYGHGEPLGEEKVDECLAGGEDAPAFTTRTGDTFRLGVDPSIAETGWLLFINGQPHGSVKPITRTYQTIDLDEQYRAAAQMQIPESQGLTVQVIQVGEDFQSAMEAAVEAEDQQGPSNVLFENIEGVWNAELTPES